VKEHFSPSKSWFNLESLIISSVGEEVGENDELKTLLLRN
jgi:hypothetical protein